MAQNLVGPQPDFAAMAASQRAVADEMDRIQNTPQFALGNAILNQLQGMEQRINARMDGMEVRIGLQIQAR